jgi:tRNA threonylcarbamoyladenosine biosynthesis protein TsaE
MTQLTTNSAAETKAFGRDLAQHLRGGENLFLRGGLGSGKTAFVQGLAEGLGITRPVKSPTYTFLQEYDLPMRSTRLAHFDLYRLPEQPSQRDLETIELFERLSDPDTITAIEWADRLERHVTDAHHVLIFEMSGTDQRSINVPRQLTGAVRR